MTFPSIFMLLICMVLQMANNECEGSTTSKQRINFVNMKEVIDSQRQKIIDMEDTNVLKADCKRDLKESLKMALKMVKRETLMDKECQKGMSIFLVVE